MFLTPDDDRTNVTIGSKAERLFRLYELGHPVPEFVVVPVEAITDALERPDAWDSFPLPADQLYAVRSAAVGEDSDESAMAGRFRSELRVPREGLRDAAQTVCADALEKGYGGRFSVIVQRYIAPEYAGVCFTRNPLGGHECVIEYRSGGGERVVGGEAVSRTRFLRAVADTPSNLPFRVPVATAALAIEQHFDGVPQDIEWAYADGAVHILQARPITTLSQDQRDGFVLLDEALPDRPFLFERTSITESFDRPTPLDLSFLEWLHASDGPVAAAYRQIGIRYRQTAQFKVLGNQLYVDKDEETVSLFPAMGYPPGEYRARVVRFSGLWTTLRHFKRFNAQRTEYQPAFASVLEGVLKTLPTPSSIEEALAAVQEHYPTIFKINLSSQLARARLERVTGDQAALNELLLVCRIAPITMFDPTTLELIGNSIVPSDRSPFVAVPFETLEADDRPDLSALNWRLRGAVAYGANLNAWLQLRELGRWVSVRLMHDLRTVLGASGVPPELQSFVHLEEYRQETLPSEKELSERQRGYQQGDRFTFPRILSRPLLPETDPRDILAVSPGDASGVLLREEDLGSVEGPVVLYVDSLLPSYTRYFDDISGIVSRQGGMLSHLAIMAREQGIPVVVTERDLEQYLHERVRVSGTEGDIEFDRSL